MSRSGQERRGAERRVAAPPDSTELAHSKQPAIEFALFFSNVSSAPLTRAQHVVLPPPVLPPCARGERPSSRSSAGRRDSRGARACGRAICRLGPEHQDVRLFLPPYAGSTSCCLPPPPDFDQSEEWSADERTVVRGSESSCRARRSSRSFILLSQFKTANLTLQRVRPLSLLHHRTPLTTRGVEVAQLPTVYITPSAGALTTFTQTTKYTLVLADAASLGDPDLTAPTEGGDYRHFLANSLVGAPATGGNSTFVTSGGNVVTAYAGPGPLVGTGPHRYSWLLFAQAGNFVAPNGLNAMTPPSHWKYVSSLSFLSTSCPPELS